MKNCRVDGCTNSAGKNKNSYCYMHYNRIMKTGSPGPAGKLRSNGLSLEDKLRFSGWDVNDNGCWLWNGTLSHGYGLVSVDGGQLLTHRAAYETWVGPIPEGMYVCHECDTPRCMNPDHLFVGTNQDNLADMRSKRRHSYGERRYNARLTEAKVLEARRLRREGVPVLTLAARFGVSKRQIYKVTNGEQWKHLNEQDPAA